MIERSFTGLKIEKKLTKQIDEEKKFCPIQVLTKCDFNKLEELTRKKLATSPSNRVNPVCSSLNTRFKKNNGTKQEKKIHRENSLAFGP